MGKLGKKGRVLGQGTETMTFRLCQTTHFALGGSLGREAGKLHSFKLIVSLFSSDVDILLELTRSLLLLEPCSKIFFLP